MGSFYTQQKSKSTTVRSVFLPVKQHAKQWEEADPLQPFPFFEKYLFYLFFSQGCVLIIRFLMFVKSIAAFLWIFISINCVKLSGNFYDYEKCVKLINLSPAKDSRVSALTFFNWIY